MMWGGVAICFTHIFYFSHFFLSTFVFVLFCRSLNLVFFYLWLFCSVNLF